MTVLQTLHWILFKGIRKNIIILSTTHPKDRDLAWLEILELQIVIPSTLPLSIVMIGLT